MAALKISSLEFLMARMAAMKNVLSPNSEISKAEKADTSPTLNSLAVPKNESSCFLVELLVELLLLFSGLVEF